MLKKEAEMEDGKLISIFLSLGVLFGSYAIFGPSEVAQVRVRNNEVPLFEVDIQSGGSGTTLRTDGLTNFGYLNGGI